VARRPNTPGQRFELALAVLSRLEAARHTDRHGLPLLALAGALRTDPLQVEPITELLVELGFVARIEEDGDPRHVLLADPKLVRAEPLLDALLLGPSVQTQAFRRRADLATMTLADLLG
jgi:membrane protein